MTRRSRGVSQSRYMFTDIMIELCMPRSSPSMSTSAPAAAYARRGSTQLGDLVQQETGLLVLAAMSSISRSIRRRYHAVSQIVHSTRPALPSRGPESPRPRGQKRPIRFFELWPRICLELLQALQPLQRMAHVRHVLRRQSAGS